MNMDDDLTINVKLSALALKLRRLRKEKGETIEQTAALIGTRPSKLLKWETDKELPALDYIELLAMHFGIDKDELLSVE